jgi:hypothetical protein
MNREQCEAMARVMRAKADDGEAGAKELARHKLGGPSLASYFAQAAICNALADAYEAAGKVAPQ